MVHCVPRNTAQQTVPKAGHATGQVPQSHGLVLLVPIRFDNVLCPGHTGNLTSGDVVDRYKLFHFIIWLNWSMVNKHSDWFSERPVLQYGPLR